MVKSRDIAGKTGEGEEWRSPETKLGMQKKKKKKKNGEAQKHSWECIRRRRRRMVKPRNTAGKTEEGEEEW